MDTYKKQMLIIFSVTLIIISAGVGIFFQIETTRKWYTTNEELFIDNNRDDGKKIDFSGDIAFVAFGIGTIRIYDFNDLQNPSHLNTISISRGFIYDQSLEGDILYILNMTNLLIFNVSDPLNIQQVGYFDVGEFTCSIFVHENIAYIATRRSFEILNVTNPQNVGAISRTPIAYNEIHDLYYEDGLVYYTNYYLGLYIYDVENPSAPELITTIGNYGSLKMAKEVTVLNGIIYLSDILHGLVIINAADINNTIIIGIYSESTPLAIYEDGNTLYLADQYAGLKTVGMGSLPEIDTLCTFGDRRGILDIHSLGDSLVVLGKQGISIVKVVRGEGRNPAEVAYVKQIIPGIYEITGVAFLAILLLQKLKRANI